MKKIILSIFTLVIFFNSLPVTQAATQEYNHDELMEYKGYGEAMYEGVVRETTFITGQYTENKQYVTDTIEEIVDYAKFWYNEVGNKSCSDFANNAECLKDILSTTTGYVMTIGDWIGKFFDGFFEKESVYNSDGIIYQKETEHEGSLFVQSPYTVEMTNPEGVLKIRASYPTSINVVNYGIKNNGTTLEIQIGYGNYIYAGTSDAANKLDAAYRSLVEAPTYSKLVYLGSLGGYTFALKSGGVDVPVTEGLSPEAQTIINHINNSTGSGNLKVATPKPRPYLSCPDGTKIQMSIDGSTFLKADGTVMIVNKDGTATVDSSICNLGWDVPNVKYDDENDKVLIEDPEGDYQDVETGEVVGGGGSDDGDDTACDSVLCNISKIFEAIAGFFDKLLEFAIRIFVPENLDFVTESFDSIKNTFDEKLGVVNVLKGTIEEAFTQENTNPLDDLTISLPATNGKPIDVVDMSIIEAHIPTVKRVMSGFVVLITVIYLYRKITGRGGVMEK